MKNFVRFDSNTCYIQAWDTDEGEYKLVEIDRDDWKSCDAAITGNWYLVKTDPKRNPNGLYVMGHACGRNIYIHRLIMGFPEKPLETHHRDHNTLNNRKSNLQVLTPSDHRKLGLSHRVTSKNKSGFRGVWPRTLTNGTIVFEAKVAGKWLGVHDTKKKANAVAAAYRENLINERRAA